MREQITQYVFWNGAFVEPHSVFLPLGFNALPSFHSISASLKVSKGKIECFDAHMRQFQQRQKEAFYQTLHIHPRNIRRLLDLNTLQDRDYELRLSSFKYQGEHHCLMSLHALEENPSVCHLQLPHAGLCTQTNRETLLLSREGYVLGTPFNSIFWIAGSTFCTPFKEEESAYDVSLMTFLAAADLLSLRVEFVKDRLEDIPEGARLYLSNALYPLTPIHKIQRKSYAASASEAQTLRQHYQEIASDLSFAVPSIASGSL